MNDRTRKVGIALLAAVAAGAAVALLVRSQIRRHRRDLFNSNSFVRMAALGHVARERASIDRVNLLRDFMAWEPRRLLKRRAQAIVNRMESELLGEAAPPEEVIP